MRIPYINPDVRYLGVSALRKMNADSLANMKAPTVIKRENGEELVVIVPFAMYIELQESAERERGKGER